MFTCSLCVCEEYWVGAAASVHTHWLNWCLEIYHRYVFMCVCSSVSVMQPPKGVPCILSIVSLGIPVAVTLKPKLFIISWKKILDDKAFNPFVLCRNNYLNDWFISSKVQRSLLFWPFLLCSFCSPNGSTTLNSNQSKSSWKTGSPGSRGHLGLVWPICPMMGPFSLATLPWIQMTVQMSKSKPHQKTSG